MKKLACIGMAVLILCIGGCGLNNGRPTDSVRIDEAMEVGLTAYVNIENSICIEEQDLVADEEVENTIGYHYVWEDVPLSREGGRLWESMMESTDITDTERAKLERFQSLFSDAQEFCLVNGRIGLEGVKTESATIEDWWTYIYGEGQPGYRREDRPVEKFALIDMDGDGREELVLYIYLRYNFAYLIIQEEEGCFIGKSYLGSTVIQIENGIGIVYAMENDFAYRYLHVCFDKENDYKDECVATVRWTDLSLKEAESVTIGGESVTKEEFEQWREEMESVEWYYSTEYN